MKRTVSVVFLLFFCLWAAFPQDFGVESTGEGFGLQASIFKNARTVATDLNRNFADASNYNLTPGDVFTLTLSSGVGLNATSGNRASSYSIQLQEDYTLDIPVLGRVDARGRRIPELQRDISERLIKALTLQYVNFTLSAPAQYNIFIYGNVQSPGFVLASPMNRLIDAIGTAGGFKANGSYRNVRLEREESVLILDISRFYSHADFTANPYLRPGDKIFVPDADIVTSVSGLVQFPGTYELVHGETLETLLDFAGGLLPGAQAHAIEIQRIDAEGVAERLVVSREDAADVVILMGDRLLVRSVFENVERITVEGAVYGSRLASDGPVAVPDHSFRLDLPYFPGITLLDILDSVGGPTPRAVPGESFLKRASTGEVHSVELKRLWTTRDKLLDVAVLPGDYIYIPLKRTEVYVSGSINRPGAVPYVPGYSVSDYLLLAGGIDDNRANVKDLSLLDEAGGKTDVSLTASVEPGSHIHVGEKWLFAADQTVQNILITTAWVTSIVTVVTTVLTFVLTYIVSIVP